jgi:hypothetical protein
MLNGAAVALVMAVGIALGGWRARHDGLRSYAIVVAGAGALVGTIVARRKRWSDVEVALFLDARFDSHETIATALQLEHASATAPCIAVVSRATRLLASEDPSKAKTRVLSRVQGLAPLAVVGLIVVARLPLPSTPVVAPEAGIAPVRLAETEGLDAIAKLGKLDGRDDEQRARLAAIARDAVALKEQLRAGLERRDAQDRIARIGDALDRERLSLGDGEKRAGLESAIARLQSAPQTGAAARALGDHDLEAMDEAMERLASSREKRDRALADEALRDAADAASRAGAPDVAKALEGERRLLAKRASDSDSLRELAQAMRDAGVLGHDEQRALDSLDREKSSEAARALAQSLEKALSKLTPEERKRLAAKLAAQATRAKNEKVARAGDSSSPAPLDERSVEEQLRALANDDSPSDEAARELALESAQRGASETESEMNGNGTSGAAGSGAGGSHDVGTGAHAGHSDVLAGDTLKSRAHTALNAASAMPGSVTTLAPGRAGDVATALATGDLRAAAPSQLDGVEKSDVPEEYRDQVRRYFNPRDTTP